MRLARPTVTPHAQFRTKARSWGQIPKVSDPLARRGQTPLTLTPAGSQQDRSIALDTPRATLQLRCPTTRTFDLVPIPSMSISINYATFNATRRSVPVIAMGAIVLA